MCRYCKHRVDNMATVLQKKSFQPIFKYEYSCVWSKFLRNWFPRIHCDITPVLFRKGLGAERAIILTKEGLVYWHIHASLGQHELIMR